MVLAQTANGILLPVILIFTVWLSSNRELMGDRANGPLYKAFIWVCAIGLMLTVIVVVQPFMP